MPTILIDGVQTKVSVEEFNNLYVAKGKKHLDIGVDGKWAGVTDSLLDTIKINGVYFTGISELTSVNTKTYIEEPKRANDGSMPNINDYEVFFVPRVTFNFKMFSIADYMAFCAAIQPNEFVVEFFDKQLGRRVTHKMYAHPEELHQIFNIETKVIGVIDFNVVLIGTLNDVSTTMLTYNINGGGTALGYIDFNFSFTYDVGDVVETVSGSNVFYKCIKISTGKVLTDTEYWRPIKRDMITGVDTSWGYNFNVLNLSDMQDYYTITGGTLLSFNTKANGTGFTYYPGQSAVLFESIVLYCIWGA